MLLKFQSALIFITTMNLKELAHNLGLSQTTVSRALNGYPEVSEATRRKVREAAEAHNYRPSVRAKSLATGRSMTIAHVVPLSSQHEMVNPIFSDFIAGAGEEYARAGYDLLLSVVPDSEQDRMYRDLVTRQAVDGLIVQAPSLTDNRIPLLNELGIPFVVHGRSTGVLSDYNWLDVNNRRAFERATGLLLDLGHRRIALVNGLASLDFANRRNDGYKRALLERGIAIDPDLIAHDEMTENYGFEVARRLLASPNPPTAFLVSSIIPAIGVRRAVTDAGLEFGRDVSIVIHDDDLSYFRNTGDVPLFTAVRSSVHEAGKRAAAMLIEIIRRRQEGLKDQPSMHTLMEAELTIGQSTGPYVAAPVRART